MAYKVVTIVSALIFAGITIVIQMLYQKAMRELMPQFDDENENKMGLRRIILYDAVLVIVGVAIFISKCVENYLDSIESVAERYFRSINLYAIIAYAVVTIAAVAYTIIAFKNAKSPKYEYRKENWVFNINGKKEFVSADVFTKRNSNGEHVGIEVAIDIGDERISVKGRDIEEAKMKLAELIGEKI